MTAPAGKLSSDQKKQVIPTETFFLPWSLDPYQTLVARDDVEGCKYSPADVQSHFALALLTPP